VSVMTVSLYTSKETSALTAPQKIKTAKAAVLTSLLLSNAFRVRPVSSSWMGSALVVDPNVPTAASHLNVSSAKTRMHSIVKVNAYLALSNVPLARFYNQPAQIKRQHLALNACQVTSLT
jgi:hypothetical protein